MCVRHDVLVYHYHLATRLCEHFSKFINSSDYSFATVDTTNDLRYARVYVSVLNKDQEKDVLKGLKSASGFLRRELGNALQLRYTPELQFTGDDSIQHGAHILELLRKEEEKDADRGASEEE